MWRIAHLLTAIAVLATPAFGQKQFAELGKQHLPIDRDHTAALAVGDVDGDGDGDLVMGNHSHHGMGVQNRLCLNDGAGVFIDVTVARMPVDSDITAAAALGDVDADGDLDLVLGNTGNTVWFGQQNRLYQNDGTGSFADATAARLPTDSDHTLAAALGDVDRDGDLDLVFGNEYEQNRLYLNDGSGTFTDATAARLPTDQDQTSAVAMADVDGDGDLDLVFANSGQNRLYLNDGTGSFTDATANRLPTDSDHTHALAAADVDGDGDLDLVFANSGQNRLYLNDGTGSFTDATANRLPTDSDHTSDLVAGDVDGDRDLDLVFGNWYENDRLYLNDGGGTFTEDPNAGRLPKIDEVTSCLAVTDADGDRHLDLILGNLGRNRLYLNDATGTFADATTTRLPRGSGDTEAMALGDLDGDGDLDALFVGDGSQRLYRNDGSGVFASAGALAGVEARSVALGDVDRDGDLDALVGYGHDHCGILLFANDGAGLLTDVSATHLPPIQLCAYAVAFADLDADGDLDALLGSNWGEGVRLLLNDGAGRFSDATTTHLPSLQEYVDDLALGDFDGDGDLDAAIGANAVRLYRNDGSGRFVDAGACAMVGPNCLAAGDVDRDGDLDLVLGTHGQSRLLLNDGAGTFTDVTATRMPPDGGLTTVVCMGDLDADGDLDLALGSWTAQDRLFVNDGTGTFTDATAARMPIDSEYTTSAALGDVDGDDDLDLVLGNVYRDRNRVYVNLHRQIDAPFLARLGMPYRLDFYAEPGYGAQARVALPFLGFSLASQPLPIPPLGTLHLEPAGMVPLPAAAIPVPAGVGELRIGVPSDPALLGRRAYAQALILFLTGPIAPRLTGYTADPILP